MFDSDTFAGQRVRLFEVNNSRPSDLAKELESVFKAYALSEKSCGREVHPGGPHQHAHRRGAESRESSPRWKTGSTSSTSPVKVTAGAVNNYVYRLKYGRAETVAMAIMALYSGNPCRADG